MSIRGDRKIICVDMDEVMADALAEHLLRYNQEFNENVTVKDLAGQWIWQYVPEERAAALERYMQSDDFFAVLGVMPDAQRVLERLQSQYDVFIATAAMEVPKSFNAKFEWLKQHFPFIPPSNIVFCGDKGILQGDYLIDDNPRQLRRFQGEGILFTSPANLNVEGFRRVNNWLDVEKMFLD
ncbi:5'-3'-deoxyribonucleotidase [Granulicella cerasi]|uniref:5'-3'-deoxyribonucleotidase n=1 Tax=Granulicella cerasi TaxID=741063 RepID=A0ABW1ZAC9_9BACT|nr:5'-3'-deoxyribonucleotidase [Granulicella cerasi]